jgi:phosphoglycolate phosphatase
MTFPVVFDLDGTQVDSAPDIHAAVNRMLETESLPPLDLPTVISFIGHGLPRLVMRVMAARDIPGDQHPRLTRLTKGFYDASPSNLTLPYPGVVAALQALRAEGHPLGICTNKPGDSALAVLGDLGLLPYFASVVGGDRLPVAKPDPAMLHLCLTELGSPGTAIYIGDSEVDAATSVAAEVPFILFTEGFRHTPAGELPSTATFNDFGQLPALIRTLAA